ncbi:LamG-like jellyroll fold domain-containing protein [Streptomyces sp. NPDC088258]|uniref:LamG-like jellyroll fold domain-containing protein n=1 Tax=Streptomyces sp. NPDC088258 TaxID=3365849 RepID=UPI003813C69E
MRTADAADAAGAGDKEPAAGESGKLAPVGVELPMSGDALVLKPDADVLAGDDTVYPVFIDPMWYTPRASAWTMASKYWASSPQWKFNGDSDAGMGYCNWSYCQPNDTKRLFYRIPTSKYAGKTILSAEFTVPNTWSASCDARSVELWRTKDISSSTTWNAQNASGFWTKRLASKSFAHGFNGCAAKDAEFDIKSAVQEAANGKASTMTFGLRAAGESDAYAWKRFSNKASLRVRYNQPPPQIKMSQLSMRYGGTCEKQSGDNLSVSPPSSIPPDKRVPSAGAPTTGSGSVSRHLPGQIDDTCLQDRVIADDEGQQQVEQRAVKGRWNFESASGTTPVTTPDLSDQQNPMTLSGGARLGAGWIDASGLELDGVNGSAGTSVMPIDTSAGFTVTAWARGAATPDHPVAVVSGEGTSESAFNVRFVPDPDDPDGLGRWQLTLPDSDGEGAAVRHVSNTEFYDVRDWNHLAVVYDGVAKQARLYVNGILQEFVCGDDDTDGTACEDLISWADNVQTFRADKSLQVGRAKTAGTWGEYFAGSIDDVWAFQGALSSGQVQKLAGSWFGLPTEVPEGD